MRYKNIETGAIIDSPSKIISKNWVVEDVKEDLYNQNGEAITGDEEVPMTKEETFEKYTKSELFEILESQDIDYKPEQTKKELIELLEGD